MEPLSRLLGRDAQPGRLATILLRPGRRANTITAVSADISNSGLEGDHYSGRGKRAITLIQAEHLPAIAAYLGLESVAPEDTRRNLLVQGINLLSLKDANFQIGHEVVLKGTGICAPCSRMEETFGPGGYNAMRGHGGITARIVKTGTIATGDTISRL